MVDCDLSRVLCILRSVYPVVLNIEEFSQSIVYKDGKKASLVEPSDSKYIKTSARRVFICTNKLLHEQVASSQQISTLSEVLAFVLNCAKEKKKSNVLSLGYTLREQEYREANQLRFQGELTQCAAFINGSNFWKIVNERLGTDVTKYLLESCTVFVAVPPSCVFQVCGVPFYSCVTTETRPAFQFVRSRSRFLPTALWYRASHVGSSHAQKKNKSAGRASHKTRKRKRVLLKQNVVEGKEDGENEGEAAADIGPVPKRMRNECEVNGQRAESCWKGTANQQEGGPSWRAGASNPLSPSHIFICTRGLMYRGWGLKGFLRDTRQRGGAEGLQRLQGRDLVRLIFFDRAPRLSCQDGTTKKLPKRFYNMVATFDRFLLQNRRFSYTGLLKKTCPVDVGQAKDLSALLALHCSPFSVYCFVRQCLCWVVPKELWGSAHNRVHFLSRVKAFLSMGRFDRLSLSELMWKMKVKDCDWLKISKTGRIPASEQRYRERLLGRFLTWLLEGYVMGLVRGAFYVTESASQKNVLRFYRTTVWDRLQQLGFSKLLSKGLWEPLTAEQWAALRKNAVVSHLRLIPKQDGLRPIVRVVRKDARARWFQARVKDLHAVLRVCVEERPSLLGSTVFGVQDIHKVLGQFAAARKDNPCPLYFVKMDVSGAYDSLPHDKLLEVVSEALSPALDEVFSVRRYAQVWADSSEILRKVFRRQAKLLVDAELSMKGFVMGLQREQKIHDAILVEQHFSSDVYGRDVLEFFKGMLSNTVIQFGKKMFRQCRGIPQGSVASTLLCCLCYGHMENALLRPLLDGGGQAITAGSLLGCVCMTMSFAHLDFDQRESRPHIRLLLRCLMRLVDDFLFMTPDLGEAQTFLKTLQGGVAEYGCVVNPQKVAVNFPLSDGCSGVQVLPPGSLFPWCGLLVDTSTLDVYNDYSLYAGLSLRSTLKLGSTPHAGRQMKRKLLSVLRLKCHALFLDLKMNSQKAVCQNVYKFVLLQAYRFHACVQNLPFGQKVNRNPPFFLLVIWEMAECTSLLVKQNNRGVALPVDLCYEAVQLMYCVSFLYVMSHHKGLYKCLLSCLRKRKVHLERKLGGLKLALIRRAFTPVLPEDIKLIKV